MSATRTYHRRMLNFSVNRAMQFRMIGKISLILFASQILCGLIFFYFSNQEITASFQMFHIKARNFLDFLLPVVISAVVVSLVLGFVSSLFFPKPIAGGLYRIEEDLKQIIRTDDLTLQIKLREGDQVTALAQQVNLLLSDLRTRVQTSQAELKKLEKFCELDPQIEEIHDRLETQIGSLKT